MKTLSSKGYVLQQKPVPTENLSPNHKLPISFKAQTTSDSFTKSNTQNAEISFGGIFEHFNKENRTIRKLGVKDSIEKVLNGDLQEFDNLKATLSKAKPSDAKLIRDYLVNKLTNNEHKMRRTLKNTLLVKLDYVEELTSKLIKNEGNRLAFAAAVEGMVAFIPIINGIQIKIHNQTVDTNNMIDQLKDFTSKDFCSLSEKAKEQIEETAINFLDRNRISTTEDKHQHQVAISLLSYGNTNETMKYLQNIFVRNIEPFENWTEALHVIPIIFSHISEPNSDSKESLLKGYLIQTSLATTTNVEMDNENRIKHLNDLPQILKLISKTNPETNTNKLATKTITRINTFIEFAKYNKNKISHEVIEEMFNTKEKLKTYTKKDGLNI